VLDPLYDLIGWILSFYYHFVPSLGISIILLTATVMLALFPLTAKQARSMIKMQQVQPEIKRIQAQYKDDKTKANEEILRYYQENKINPLSGCLPLLMQMPVFIALFGVLRGLDRDPPGHLPTTGAFDDLYVDLGRGVTRATQFLGMNLSTSPLEAKGGFGDTLPYFVVVALIVATGWYQARQTMSRAAKSGAGANPQMQIIGKVMPIMFGVFSLNFVAGLNIYFLTSNLWRVGQQQLVLNKIYDEGQAQADKQRQAVEAEARDVPADAPPRRRANPNTSRKKRQRRKR
jgi:YidC/Oxa1 family membrane protein insertase